MTKHPIQQLLEIFDEGHRVSTDSRSIRKGDIFFALKGEHFNGNQYALQALENGAILSVVDEEMPSQHPDLFQVENVLEALQKMALAHRKRLDIPVIGITGSNGKTTTKELLHSVLTEQFNVCTTKGNLNNHIGVPLTLLELNAEHELAVLELGASEPGEIAVLCEICQPTAGLVTNVGKAHLEGFGSEQVVFNTKMALYDYLLNTRGTIFVPQSIQNHRYFRKEKYPSGLYFTAENALGEKVQEVDLVDSFPRICIRIKDNENGEFKVQTQLFGSYNFNNLLNVIKIADYFGLTPEQCKTGIEKYKPNNNRSQIMEDASGNMLILDAYNSNPSSVEEALNHFLPLNDNRPKMLILGDMLELGDIRFDEHQKVLERLAEYPEFECMLVGEIFFDLAETIPLNLRKHMKFFNNTVSARIWWKKQSVKDTLILVKGSRGIALESIFDEE